MKVTEAPEKIYVVIDPIWGSMSVNYNRNDTNNIEYIKKDALIEKAAEFLYNYNQKQVLKHGAMATLGCGEYTINVDEFRKYMKGE